MTRTDLLIALLLSATGTVLSAAEQPTYSEDVEPILRQHCLPCHQPGEVAPMSLTSYGETRPWARSIRNAVATREMPPWFAAPDVGAFRNDRRLSQREIDTLVQWVDAGAPLGQRDESEAPPSPPARDADDWLIGEPDLVVAMPQPFEVPESGVIDYVYLRMPTGLEEGRWVQAIEVRPGQRDVIHHIDVIVCRPGCPSSRSMSRLEAGVATQLPSSPIEEQPTPSNVADVEGTTREFLTSFLPGGRPLVLPPGTAKWLPPGADIVLNIHYTPNGTPASDRSEVGFVFSEAPSRRVISYFLDNYTLWIPAGDRSYSLDSTASLARDAELLALTPHMHSRGIAAAVEIVDPTGAVERVLSVPRYDFDWQITYELEHPRHLSRSSQIRYRLVWDNSAGNPDNPDPTRDVPWGRQTSDEMASLFVTVSVPRDVEPDEVFQ